MQDLIITPLCASVYFTQFLYAFQNGPVYCCVNQRMTQGQDFSELR